MSLPQFTSHAEGSLDFGGADASKHTGKLTYTPITKTDPATDYWGIDQSIQYGSSTILKLTAGIVDSGSTMILLATGMCPCESNTAWSAIDKCDNNRCI